MLSAHPSVRWIPGVARRHQAFARRPPEETGALRRPTPDPLSGSAKALRIYSDAEGPRPLSDHHVDRALGQHPHGRLARTAAAARTQELQEDVRSHNGLLGMR